MVGRGEVGGGEVVGWGVGELALSEQRAHLPYGWRERRMGSVLRGGWVGGGEESVMRDGGAYGRGGRCEGCRCGAQVSRDITTDELDALYKQASSNPHPPRPRTLSLHLSLKPSRSNPHHHPFLNHLLPPPPPTTHHHHSFSTLNPLPLLPSSHLPCPVQVKGKGVTMSALLAKAVGMTLAKHPLMNSAYVADGERGDRGWWGGLG